VGPRNVIISAPHSCGMAAGSAMEMRLELYADGSFPPSLADQITKLLAQWWPETWDVKVPERPSLQHPAEWRAVVPLPDGATPESVHLRVEAGLSGLDPSGSLHYRTRWAFQEAPNHQEVYEVRWTPEKR
jgi:hypothetical protein